MTRVDESDTNDVMLFLNRDPEYVRDITLSIDELIYPIASLVRRIGCYPIGSVDYCNGVRLVWGPAIVREESGFFSVFNCSLLNTRESKEDSRGFRRDLPPADAVRLYLIANPFDFYGHEMYR